MTNTITNPSTQSSILNRQSSIPSVFEHVRNEFPALAQKTFLDAACVSLAPRVATQAIRGFLEMAEACPAPSPTQHHIDMDRLREAARPEAARLINGLGRENLWRHIAGLTDYLIDGLRRLGLRVVTPAEPESRSGIVTFSVGTAGDNVALMQRLLERRILVSVRYTSGVGGVRVSCHFFNNLEDIDRLLHGIKSC